VVRQLGSVWFNGGEGRGGILIKYVFGSKERRGGEVRYFN
jgi:hypothetical protein